jgi:hypothetical protein
VGNYKCENHQKEIIMPLIILNPYFVAVTAPLSVEYLVVGGGGGGTVSGLNSGAGGLLTGLYAVTASVPVSIMVVNKKATREWLFSTTSNVTWL